MERKKVFFLSTITFLRYNKALVNCCQSTISDLIPCLADFGGNQVNIGERAFRGKTFEWKRKKIVINLYMFTNVKMLPDFQR